MVAKNSKKLLLSLVLAITLLLGACSGNDAVNNNSAVIEHENIEERNLAENEVTTYDGNEASSYAENEEERVISEDEATSYDVNVEDEYNVEVSNKENEVLPLNLTDIPEFDGTPYVEINNNIPVFSDEDKKSTTAFENYSEFDNLGRCGQAYANVCLELMPTEERGEIGSIKPSGWHTVKYNDIIDGNYLYNRCHLIGYQLAGENANERNLITGTRYLNVTGMLPFENMVDDYIEATNNHVLYRVTPVFEGDNLVASGVQMEAWSVEDEGKGICFNVYCYNVQPGIDINYANGESQETESVAAVSNTNTNGDNENNNKESSDSAVVATFSNNGTDTASSGTEYILNTNTKKFHYPNCKSVKQMSDKNKSTYIGNRDEIISMGYEPCGNCNP